MERFVYTGLPARVLFGVGARRELPAELDRLGARRALILSTPRRQALVEEVTALLGDRVAGHFAGAVTHTPVEVVARAQAALRETGADCVIAAGGGSTIDLSKALGLRDGVPQIVLVTTYSGSEMSPTVGLTENGVKTAHRSLETLPETVIYDVELSLDLPVPVSVTSGINALAHAAEALYGREANPVTTAIAEMGIRDLAAGLPALVADPHDLAARSDALRGAWLCASSLTAGTGLHHKLCHVLGGSLGLPHADSHTVMLPYVLAYNAPAAPEAMARLAAALGVAEAARGLWEWQGGLGAPRSLAELGMREDALARAVTLALTNPPWNPRPFDAAAVRALYTSAWAGEPPQG